MNTLSISSTPLNTSSADDVLGLLLADEVGEGADALGQRGAKARLVRAAVGRRDGVAVIAFDAPSLHTGQATAHSAEPWPSGKSCRPAKGGEVTHSRPSSCSFRWSARPPGNWNTACSGTSVAEPATGRSASGFRPRRRDRPWTGPACRAGPGSNVASAPKISRSGVKVTVVPRRLGAAPTSSSGRGGDALGEALAVELLLARYLDDGFGRKGVDDRDADAVQAAGGRIGLAFELAARVERGEDHLERRLARIFGVRVDRDAAAVVGDGQAVARFERDLDPAGMAGDRLVHRIVDDFGGEMVERAGVGAADIHARPAADRLEALEDLDRGSVVSVGGLAEPEAKRSDICRTL